MRDTSNSERFLRAFSRIERFLKEKASHQRHRSFYQLVEFVAQRDPAVKEFEMDLKEYADLRNAIIHERRGGDVIAEPNVYAVEDIVRIAALIRKPPAVLPLFQVKIAELSENEPISRAVALIYSHSISQVPIRRGATVVALLTANTISRWLGACSSQQYIDLNATPISTVLRYTEDRENHVFLSRTASVFDVLKLFHRVEHEGKRLDAILITNQGKPHEKTLGIVTISDLPKAFRAVTRSTA